MRFTAMLLSISLFVSAGSFIGQEVAAVENKKPQTISRAGSQPSVKGPAEYFTGNVRVDPLFPANDSAPFSGAYVTFEPGARSAWHIHPKGQHLLVTAGVGRTGEWEGGVEEIKAGDVIWCPPGIKHWHGASPTTAMTHIAIKGRLNGKSVEWMEKSPTNNTTVNEGGGHEHNDSGGYTCLNAEHCSHCGGTDGEYSSVNPQTTEHRYHFGFYGQW
jgi:quercetin dioxygenase-like cupin family protein